MVNCEFFEIIDWNEETQEIYHAVCTMPSPCWPNCNKCQSRVEYRDVEYGNKVLMERWLLGKHITLTQGDVDILDGSGNRKVRIDPNMDAEVKNLYDMYKSL